MLKTSIDSPTAKQFKQSSAVVRTIDCVADEGSSERLDRELIELLNELRVALPGVQVLFALLLTAPFSPRFPRLSDLQRDVYFAAFLATAAASIFLMTPSAYHRLRWRRYDKERMLVFSNRTAIAGIAFLAIAISLVVFLVSDLMFEATVAATATGAISAVLVFFWFGIPLSRNLRSGNGDPKDASGDESREAKLV